MSLEEQEKTKPRKEKINQAIRFAITSPDPNDEKMLLSKLGLVLEAMKQVFFGRFV